jgi:hypothetical protein
MKSGIFAQIVISNIAARRRQGRNANEKMDGKRL